MAIFSRVAPLTTGAGFTLGAPPKGILLTGDDAAVHVKDVYGNGFTAALSGAAHSQIFPIQISEAITVSSSGNAYVLW